MLLDSQGCRSRLIVTDGVFSMDGNVCPLPEIKRLAEKYNALIFMDECHATGFFGATGRGTEEFYNMEGSVDIINSTLGKALGGAAGGYETLHILYNIIIYYIYILDNVIPLQIHDRKCRVDISPPPEVQTLLRL